LAFYLFKLDENILSHLCGYTFSQHIDNEEGRAILICEIKNNTLFYVVINMGRISFLIVYIATLPK